MPSIFISYRREDSAGHAGRLYDRLAAEFGENAVFIDVDAIEFGLDFVKQIDDFVGKCDALIAVIGHDWLTVADRDGQPRLKDPGDFVRLEIAAALERDVRVVPVLVGEAAMPRADELPSDIQALSRRHGLELSDARWSYDVGRLVRNLRTLDGDSPESEPHPVEAPPRKDEAARRTTQAAAPPKPAPRPRASGSRVPGSRVGALIAGISGVALFLLMFTSWFKQTAPSTGPTKHPSAWANFGTVDYVLAIAVVSAVGLAIVAGSARSRRLVVTVGVITAALGILAVALIAYSIASPPGLHGFTGSPAVAAWMGLVAAAGIAAGAWLSARGGAPVSAS